MIVSMALRGAIVELAACKLIGQMIPMARPSVSSLRLAGALVLALLLAGCAPPEVKVEITGVALESQGQARLCGVAVPLDRGPEALTATFKACDGKVDAIMATPAAQFIHCKSGPLTKGRGQTLRFKVTGVDCVAAP
ncbi:MAG: hypothetical protein JWM33_2830 [Caulobacteraceae bacterium]|nr:hypothetical protein [Caulobacteraceae bacterium]